MKKKKRYKIKEIATALEKNAGLKAAAARELGISFQAIYQRINRSEELRQLVAEIDNQILDIGESALFKAAKAGESWAVCFLLKCKGKHRGYIERSEVDFRLKKNPKEMDDSELESTVRAVLAGISTEEGTQQK